MSNVLSLAGRFDAAALEALCVDNTEPTFGEKMKARAELGDLVAAATDILLEHPIRVGYYVKEQPAFRPIVDMMTARGWRMCGSGYYSAAFFQGGLCIKLGFKAEDSALMYSAWCRANQGRAGVPVIHHLMSMGTCWGVLMDRLEAIAGELEDGTSAYDPILAAELDSVKGTLNLGEEGWGQHMELCRTALDIRSFFVGIANFDIHEANVMLDRNGNLIITDPVSFAGDYQSLSNDNEGYSGYHPDRLKAAG